MEQPKAVPSLSPAESEAFWRTGHDARAAEPGSDPETIQQNSEAAGIAWPSQDCAAVGDCSHNGSLAALDGRVSAGDAPLPLRELAGGDIEQSAELKQCGVDVPGVGHVRAANIPGSAYVEGEVPETLRAFLDDSRRLGHAPESEARILRRASLLIRLMFAARDLAELNVTPGRHGYLTLWCSECQVKLGGGKEHAETCRTGRVTAILDELHALDGGIAKLEVHNPDTKEAAADRETGCAGDGIRPRGLAERVCLKCGMTGGMWTAFQRPEAEVELALLGLNQCVSASADGKGHVLYTHQCPTGSAAGTMIDELHQNGGAR